MTASNLKLKFNLAKFTFEKIKKFKKLKFNLK